MFQRPSKAPRRRIVKSESLPAPIKGLNTRDPLAAMDPAYAIQLTNYTCTPAGVAVREGYREWATGMTGYVNSLMVHRPALSANARMFALANGEIFNVTGFGVVGAPVVTGLIGTELRHVNFLTSAGQVLIICNGVDPIYHFDGTTWVQWTNVSSPTTPGQINGVNPAALIAVVAHQRRLWFVETNSSRAWYLPVNSIGGAAQQFDFGPLFPRGGKLMALASWSTSGGTGMQDQLVAVSEYGDLVIYVGTDPSSSVEWKLGGTWRLGPPAHRNCFLKQGADVLFLSQDGLLPLSAYISSGNVSSALTDVIRPTISSLVATVGNINGWHLHDSPSHNLLIINVPQADRAQNFQLVLQTITGGWSVWTGMPAQSWVTFGADEFFAGNGKVFRAFAGYKDAAVYAGTGGVGYIASAQQSFNYFEDRARNKRFTMARLNLLSSTSNPQTQIGVNTDFNVTTYDTVSSGSASGASIWGTSIWNTATWQGTLTNINDFQSVSGIGYCGSITAALNVNSETLWVASDVMFEVGGLIG